MDEVNAPAGQPGLLAEYLRETVTDHPDFDTQAALAVKMTGLQTCLINLVDTDVQWTIGSCGSPVSRFPSDESVCQYTILQDMPFEVKDLTRDRRFSCLKSLQRSGLRYYYGIPLASSEGTKIGALCVLDPQPQELSPAIKETLRLLAEQTAKQLESVRTINRLHGQLEEAAKVKRMLAHDIRGPLHGIQGLSRLALEDLQKNRNEELPVYLEYIAQSGHSLLHLTDGILAAETQVNGAISSALDFESLRKQVCQLLLPAVKQKRIRFTFELSPELKGQQVPHAQLLQVLINLAGNAIKFTPEKGHIRVRLLSKRLHGKQFLCLSVADDGIGMTEELRQRILSGNPPSTPGTLGEAGSGLGLRMLQSWLKDTCGRLSLRSGLGEGTVFTVIVPA